MVFHFLRFLFSDYILHLAGLKIRGVVIYLLLGVAGVAGYECWY